MTAAPSAVLKTIQSVPTKPVILTARGMLHAIVQGLIPVLTAAAVLVINVVPTPVQPGRLLLIVRLTRFLMPTVQKPSVGTPVTPVGTRPAPTAVINPQPAAWSAPQSLMPEKPVIKTVFATTVAHREAPLLPAAQMKLPTRLVRPNVATPVTLAGPRPVTTAVINPQPAVWSAPQSPMPEKPVTKTVNAMTAATPVPSPLVPPLKFRPQPQKPPVVQLATSVGIKPAPKKDRKTVTVPVLQQRPVVAVVQAVKLVTTVLASKLVAYQPALASQQNRLIVLTQPLLAQTALEPRPLITVGPVTLDIQSLAILV